MTEAGLVVAASALEGRGGRAVLAVSVIAGALAVAFVLERRRSEPPTQPERYSLPAQLDRRDFSEPDKPWLVVVFSSRTCESCAATIAKAQVLVSSEVAVQDVPWQDRKDLHDRYAIDVAPATLLVDAEGVVHASFVGEPTATDLWAALAEARQPGVSPEPHLGH